MTDGDRIRLEVVAGGEPTADQLAALTLAVDQLHADELAERAVPEEPAMSGWLRAALHEAIGKPPATSPPDAATAG